MSDSTASLQRKIKSAGDLESVVHTMKALAASSIGQYVRSVSALEDYYRTVELGLGACLRQSEAASPTPEEKVSEEKEKLDTNIVGAIVFGSDQGLVGQFNEVIADFAIRTLSGLPGKPRVWAVGDRVHDRLTQAGLRPLGKLAVPNSVTAITPLVGEIQVESEGDRVKNGYTRVYVFHNSPRSGTLYEPVSQRLLPLDAEWRKGLVQIPWPVHTLPQVMSGIPTALRALVREYLFISLFRACAESLASENASRLAAMERANKNIKDLLEKLRGDFQRKRQSSIDEELFDVVSGSEALAGRN